MQLPKLMVFLLQVIWVGQTSFSGTSRMKQWLPTAYRLMFMDSASTRCNTGIKVYSQPVDRFFLSWWYISRCILSQWMDSFSASGWILSQLMDQGTTQLTHPAQFAGPLTGCRRFRTDAPEVHERKRWGSGSLVAPPRWWVTGSSAGWTAKHTKHSHT